MTYQVTSEGYATETATAPPIPVPTPPLDPDEAGTGAGDGPAQDGDWNVRVVSSGSMPGPVGDSR